MTEQFNAAEYLRRLVATTTSGVVRSHRKTLTQCADQIEALQKDVQVAQGQYLGAVDIIKQKEVEIKDLQTKNAELERRVTSLEVSESNMEAYERIIGKKTYREVAEELEALQQRVAELEAENKELDGVMDDHNRVVNELHMECSTKAELLRVAKGALGEYDNTVKLGTKGELIVNTYADNRLREAFNQLKEVE
jgi:predicted  nucleic acid-binding Zn-ribbon protein